VKFGAVIAAAGLSSRMGAFKPLLSLGNSTFVERIINTLREGGVKEITVVTGRDASLIKAALAPYDIAFIHNKDYAVTDMFYSVSLGLRLMAEQVDAVFFTPVDTPLFKAGTIRLLAANLQNSNDHITIPVYQGKSGHPVAIRSLAAKLLIGSKTQRGLRGAIDAYSGPKTALKVDDPGILYDSDTPEDYKFLTGLVASNIY
jgi:CTP:molybdopterin cytidylyltransferase MocA